MARGKLETKKTRWRENTRELNVGSKINGKEMHEREFLCQQTTILQRAKKCKYSSGEKVYCAILHR
jgi:hypothetical protein